MTVVIVTPVDVFAPGSTPSDVTVPGPMKPAMVAFVAPEYKVPGVFVNAAFAPPVAYVAQFAMLPGVTRDELKPEPAVI